MVEKEILLQVVGYSPPSLKLEEEVTPLAVEQILRSTPMDPSFILVVAKVLGNLGPEEEGF